MRPLLSIQGHKAYYSSNHNNWDEASRASRILCRRQLELDQNVIFLCHDLDRWQILIYISTGANFQSRYDTPCRKPSPQVCTGPINQLHKYCVPECGYDTCAPNQRFQRFSLKSWCLWWPNLSCSNLSFVCACVPPLLLTSLTPTYVAP